MFRKKLTKLKNKLLKSELLAPDYITIWRLKVCQSENMCVSFLYKSFYLFTVTIPRFRLHVMSRVFWDYSSPTSK